MSSKVSLVCPTCGISFEVAPWVARQGRRFCSIPCCPPNRGALKHGAAIDGKLTPEYIAWRSLRGRCLNPKNPKYPRYGGRGITVEWDSFEQFREDMGERPSPRHSVNRVDNDGPYSKANCVWSTPREQSNNTRRNVRLTFQGRTQTLSEWARELGMRPGSLVNRISTYGWSVERALTTPAGRIARRNSLQITFQGRTQPLAAWARELGMSHGTLRSRIVLYGWSPERALSTPVSPKVGQFRPH